jgi:hypothetical protein
MPRLNFTINQRSLEQMDQATESVAIPDVTEEVTERPLTPREQAMEAISSSRTSQFEEESGISLSPQEEQVAEQLAEPEPAPEPEVQKIKVKVDGVEQEVDVDTLVRTFQKNSAADRRLEEATRLLREAEERAAQAESSSEQQVVEQSSDDLRAEAAQIIDRMYDGDKEAAAEALIQLMSKSRGGDQPTYTPSVVDEGEITDRVLARMAVNAAFEKVKTDYPEIISNQDLEVLTAMKIDRAVAAGTPRAQAMLEAADEVYRSIGKEPAGRQKPAPVNSRQDNKARLDNIPTASASATPSESPQENSSPSSVIAEMAKKRLGQSLSL